MHEARPPCASLWSHLPVATALLKYQFTKRRRIKHPMPSEQPHHLLSATNRYAPSWDMLSRTVQTFSSRRSNLGSSPILNPA